MSDVANLRRYEMARNNAIWFLRMEALIVAALTLYLIVAALFADVTNQAALVGEILFGIIGALGLLACSVGFQRRKSFGRAPAVLANLIALGVSYFMITGGLVSLGIPLAILAIITFLAALFGYQEPAAEVQN